VDAAPSPQSQYQAANEPLPAVDVSVTYTVSGAQPLAGAASKVAVGGVLAETVPVTLSLQPLLFVTVRVTVTSPALKACVAVGWAVEVTPSPKSQCQAVSDPLPALDVSVKTTVSGAQPPAGEELKAAVGAVVTVIVLETASRQPEVSVTVKVTVYKPPL
jgi:hypothetical protein